MGKIITRSEVIYEGRIKKINNFRENKGGKGYF